MAEIETLGEHGFMGREEKETDGRGGGGLQRKAGDTPESKAIKRRLNLLDTFNRISLVNVQLKILEQSNQGIA